jgi:hypothetical protein
MTEKDEVKKPKKPTMLCRIYLGEEFKEAQSPDSLLGRVPPSDDMDLLPFWTTFGSSALPRRRANKTSQELKTWQHVVLSHVGSFNFCGMLQSGQRSLTVSAVINRRHCVAKGVSVVQLHRQTGPTEAKHRQPIPFQWMHIWVVDSHIRSNQLFASKCMKRLGERPRCDEGAVGGYFRAETGSLVRDQILKLLATTYIASSHVLGVSTRDWQAPGVVTDMETTMLGGLTGGALPWSVLFCSAGGSSALSNSLNLRKVSIKPFKQGENCKIDLPQPDLIAPRHPPCLD